MTFADVYPTIQWTEPQHVEVVGYGEGFNCRICVATFGFRGSDGPHFKTVEEGRAHIAEVHPEYMA